MGSNEWESAFVTLLGEVVKRRFYTCHIAEDRQVGTTL